MNVNSKFRSQLRLRILAFYRRIAAFRQESQELLVLIWLVESIKKHNYINRYLYSSKMVQRQNGKSFFLSLSRLELLLPRFSWFLEQVGFVFHCLFLQQSYLKLFFHFPDEVQSWAMPTQLPKEKQPGTPNVDVTKM